MLESLEGGFHSGVGGLERWLTTYVPRRMHSAGLHALPVLAVPVGLAMEVSVTLTLTLTLTLTVGLAMEVSVTLTISSFCSKVTVWPA